MSVSFDRSEDGPRANYRCIAESKAEDYAIQGLYQKALHDGVADLYMGFLKRLQSPHLGFPVDRMTHSLQTATRALRDNRDDEYVFVALFHDVGDAVAPGNHPEAGAALLRPYISEKNYWMVRHHGVFQGYYYYQFIGREQHLRDEYKGHKWFDYTAEFCHLYDQTAFDKDYDTLPLEEFEPLVRQFLGKPPVFHYK